MFILAVIDTFVQCAAPVLDQKQLGAKRLQRREPVVLFEPRTSEKIRMVNDVDEP